MKRLVWFAITFFSLLVVAFVAWNINKLKPVNSVSFTSQYPVAFDTMANGEIIILLRDGRLLRLNPSTRIVTDNIILDGLNPGNPSVSPDGKYIVYAAGTSSNGPRHLFFRPMAGKSKAMQITFSDFNDDNPTFSPNGNEICFTRAIPYVRLQGPEIRALFSIRPNGTYEKRITQNTFSSLSKPSYSKNGGSIVFSGQEFGANINTPTQLYLLRLNSSPIAKPILFNVKRQQTQLTGALASDPQFARSGNKIVYVSDRNQSFVYEVFVSEYPSLIPSSLHTNSISNYIISPQFTPDERRILFLAASRRFPDGGTSNGVWELWSCNTEGERDFRRVYPLSR